MAHHYLAAAHAAVPPIQKSMRTLDGAARLTEQGDITDRHAKAIEQLGSAELDVRLGGVDALERIAVDSKRDHHTVVRC